MFTAILSTFLALNPTTIQAPDDFPLQLDYAEFIDGGDDVQMIAYDDSGAVIGSIALWVDADGTTWAVSDYADGFTVVMIDADGDVQVDGTLAPALTAERADLLVSTLDPAEPAQGRWFKCAALTGVMVGTCATGSLIACPFSAMVAACECLPKLEPKWKHKSCS